MASIVFDSSVLMAIIQGESIRLQHLPAVNRVSMSTVNVAEVCTLLAQTQDSTRRSGFEMLSFLRTIEPFTEAQARSSGELRRLGRNISLGERACLALALDLEANVYTADRAWKSFSVKCPIHLIR